MTTPTKQELMEEIQRLTEIVERMPDDKPKQWQPQGGDWFIGGDGFVINLDLVGGTTTSCRLFGAERPTKELAEKARDAMRIHNRLLAYVHEHAPNYEPDWNNRNKPKHFVDYQHDLKTWTTFSNTKHQHAGLIYMPEEVAKELVKKLNNKEVVL